MPTSTRDGGKVAGKVAFITGAARGQGRSHAVRLAEEGADIIALDIAAQIESVPYPMATDADLDETASLVEKAGGRCLTVKADVRDIHAMDDAVRAGIAEFGGIDIVIANAGILFFSTESESLDESARKFADATDVMLTGVYNTLRVTQQPLIERGTGGSVILISSTAGLRGMLDGSGGLAGYCASKHALVGLMRGYAKLLGKHKIRVNVIHPMGVASPMLMNPEFEAFVAERADVVDVSPRLVPVELLEVGDVSAAVLWLVSDEARYVTGISLPVDAGVTCA